MRELKFRAWDTKRNCWCEKFFISQDGHAFQDCDPKGVTMDSSRKIVPNPDLIVEQFTGILDYHRFNIYEGSIIKSIENGQKWIVIFRYGSFCKAYYEQNSGKYHTVSRLVPDSYFYGYGLEGYPLLYEIIGNIHENGYLLECGV